MFEVVIEVVSCNDDTKTIVLGGEEWQIYGGPEGQFMAHKNQRGNGSGSSGRSGVMLSDLLNTLFDECPVKPNPKMVLV